MRTRTWFGYYQSWGEVLEAAQPRLAALAETLQDIATHLPASAIQPGAPIEPQPVYGPPAVRPNTDILAVSEVQDLTGPRRERRRPMESDWASTRERSRYLVPISNWVRNRETETRRPQPARERMLALATDLKFVVIVSWGSMELVPLDAADRRWRASETIQLAVTRLQDRTVVAATDLPVAVTFEEIDDTRLEGDLWLIELPGQRTRRRRERPEAREVFARDALWHEAERRMPAVLQALTGGQFTGPRDAGFRTGL